MGYFSQVGILGWDHLEGIILAAMLGQKAVLFNGLHGANKTEGCAAITRAVFGRVKFVPYDTSLVQPDDLLGFMHPDKLRVGTIEYISTPDSIWDASVVLLDEINRCNPAQAAKFFEIVRSRTINGRPTALQAVFAAVNPPNKYNTSFMDAAQVSRFVVLPVPNLKEMDAGDRRAILADRAPVEPGLLADRMKHAATLKVSKAQTKNIEDKALKVAEELNSANVDFSGRQLVDLRNLLMNMDRISMAFDEIEIKESAVNLAIMGLIPEVSGLIRGGGANVQTIGGKIATIIKGFKFSDPVMMATTLKEMAVVKLPKDVLGWSTQMVDKVMGETFTAEDIKESWAALQARKDIPPATLDSLRRAYATKGVLTTIKAKGNAGSLWLEDIEPMLKDNLKERPAPVNPAPTAKKGKVRR